METINQNGPSKVDQEVIYFMGFIRSRAEEDLASYRQDVDRYGVTESVAAASKAIGAEYNLQTIQKMDALDVPVREKLATAIREITCLLVRNHLRWNSTNPLSNAVNEAKREAAARLLGDLQGMADLYDREKGGPDGATA